MAKAKQTPYSKALATWKKLSTPRRILTILIILLGASVVLTFLRVALVGSLDGGRMGVSQGYAVSGGARANTLSMPSYAPQAEKAYVATDAYEGDVDAYDMTSSYMPMPEPEMPGGVGMYDEREYDAISYNATIRTRKLDEVCDGIEIWKPLEYVVFEYANRNEQQCAYRFKATHENADAVLQTLQELDPDVLNTNIETTKKQQVRYDGQLEILLRKQALLETTLNDSVLAYDELVELAKDTEEVEVLSKVIDSKLQQIERLTRDRIALASQLQSLSRTMTDLQDRVQFVYFDVRIYKDKVVDGDVIADSWKGAMKGFVRDVNMFMQSITLGLLLNLLALAQVLLYLAFGLVLVKYGWRIVRAFWKSE